MSGSFGDGGDGPAPPRRIGGLGRYLMMPLRSLLSRAEDPEVARARAMTDAELADALVTEIHAAQNADDEVWVEGLPLVAEAARRLRER
ncbi:hypothetical protein GCM10008171_06840 [Methylopila jiangsuensis]|uniref:Uncharacterized protein n=1 Tax=Methylopila jiangsuensis TaxID=586230 RepID=A0A9W6N2M4_9HYPH|nr:hypothetical protein [Methylopila jiangsuensis]MDR6285670.1 hypothetical protein [Methylopila jiangsuensis]GLK75430.1 hypothetical protein GCM10008171_06840 [Methylopila jiangsuensis]